VGPRAGLNAAEKIKIAFPCRESKISYFVHSTINRSYEHVELQKFLAVNKEQIFLALNL
jgi:hypothetical protein